MRRPYTAQPWKSDILAHGSSKPTGPLARAYVPKSGTEHLHPRPTPGCQDTLFHSFSTSAGWLAGPGLSRLPHAGKDQVPGKGAGCHWMVILAARSQMDRPIFWVALPAQLSSARPPYTRRQRFLPNLCQRSRAYTFKHIVFLGHVSHSPLDSKAAMIHRVCREKHPSWDRSYLAYAVA